MTRASTALTTLHSWVALGASVTHTHTDTRTHTHTHTNTCVDTSSQLLKRKCGLLLPTCLSTHTVGGEDGERVHCMLLCMYVCVEVQRAHACMAIVCICRSLCACYMALPLGLLGTKLTGCVMSLGMRTRKRNLGSSQPAQDKQEQQGTHALPEHMKVT